jgi:hypothetical protein
MLWLLESERGHSGTILECTVLYSGFKEVSNNYYLSNMFSPNPLGKWQLP